jgi:hypothetical protein
MDRNAMGRKAKDATFRLARQAFLFSEGFPILRLTCAEAKHGTPKCASAGNLKAES